MSSLLSCCLPRGLLPQRLAPGRRAPLRRRRLRGVAERRQALRRRALPQRRLVHHRRCEPTRAPNNEIRNQPHVRPDEEAARRDDTANGAAGPRRDSRARVRRGDDLSRPFLTLQTTETRRRRPLFFSLLLSSDLYFSLPLPLFFEARTGPSRRCTRRGPRAAGTR